MTNRRDFLKKLGIAGIATGLPSFAAAGNLQNRSLSSVLSTNFPQKDEMIWAVLIHLSYNMWQDFTPEKYRSETYSPSYTAEEAADWAHYYQPMLTCDKTAWDNTIQKMAESGLNMVLIDLGDGVKYETHPEIGVRGAWRPDELRKSIAQIRSYGIEPIPKLNFSAAHKAWLGQYQYILSSDRYYEVCKNLITEVIDIFDRPRYFHLGMDEETYYHQVEYDFIVVRQNEQWWKDFYFLVDQVERHNVRSWIWSDMAWQHKEEFFKKMPKSVLQSNWNYEEKGATFNEKGEANDIIAEAFFDLEEKGYDQVPSASLWLNGEWNNYTNFDNIVRNCKRIIAPDRLKGFMQTIWMPMLTPCYPYHEKAIELVGEAKRKYGT